MCDARSAVFFCFALVFAPLLSASTDFDDDQVPLDLLLGLIQNAVTGHARITPGIHEDFPDMTLPDTLSVLGSAEQPGTIRTVLRGPENAESAIEALLEGFRAHGFTAAPIPDMGQQTGFVRQQAPQRPVQLCSDEAMVTVMTGTQPGYSLITLSISTSEGFPQTFCSRLDSSGQDTARALALAAAMGGQGSLRDALPRLVLPEESRQPPRAFIDGGSRSGSGNRFETNHTLLVDWPIDSVYRHFAEQVNAQGWSPLGELMEQPVSAGHWTRRVDTDTHLVGTLLIVETAAETFDLRFQMQRLD